MRTSILLFLFLILAVIGCAGGDSNNPTVPTLPSKSSPAFAGNRHLWGLWDVYLGADHQTVEVVPMRIAGMHLNTVRLLEVTPCKDCLKISNVKVVELNVIEADVTLTHPYPGLLKYTGFDVRGILISEGNYTFPVSGRKIAWGDSVSRMLNPDGYTALFNPTEYPPTKPAALGYIPGKMATGGDLSATLNPFVAYRKDAPRRMFESGGSETRTVRIYTPTGPIHFGYAVDACWVPVDQVIDPLKDFPPEANCLEAYKTKVDLPGQLGSTPGSQAAVYVEVFDHQGLDTVSSVTIEAPDLFSGALSLAYSTQTGEESWLFSGTITNETGMGHGFYPLLAKVVDTESDQNLGKIDAWQVARAGVEGGWARTWGGTEYFDYGFAAAVDGSGNVYVTGCFGGTVDFDPGPDVDNHVSNGLCDAFLTKFDSSGNFIWARTWGGTGDDRGYGAALDSSGNVYVTGWFEGTADFDPGPDVDNHVSNGYTDTFLTKFDSSGNFIWARTFGGTEYYDCGDGATVDSSGNIYVTGYFWGTVDFDPGPDVDNHVSNGSGDAFLTKLDSSGNFIWARTWGEMGNDCGCGAAVDGSENVYVTGYFNGTVDFDPGPDVDIHVSNGEWDTFLTKFDSGGNFIGARTWGGTGYDHGRAAAVDGSGNVYAAGYFGGTVDFDPGPDVDNHVSNGLRDAFLTRFDSSGSFIWARTWGGIGYDEGCAPAVDGSGNVYIAGWLTDEVDFDPGPGIDNHVPNGEYDAFLSKFPPDGNW